MNGNVWDGLKYFKKDSTVDKWGDPSRIDPFLLQYLDAFREEVGKPVFVTSGYRKDDPRQHGLGRAVDIVCPDWDRPLFDLYLVAERFGFGGLGIYRDWFYNGKRVGGLHLDVRMLDTPKASRWFCIRPGADRLSMFEEISKIKQVYLALDTETLRREGVI